MKDIGLLVIDFQKGMTKYMPYALDQTIHTIQSLVSLFRTQGLPVIYVRHTEGEEEFKEGTDDWQVDPRVGPLPGEFIFNKSHSSSFKETPLKPYLNEHGIQKLILCGMQTEYCIDTTAKAGFEHGFEIWIADQGHTTFDNSVIPADKIYLHYNKIIFNDSFSKVLTYKEIEKMILSHNH